MPIQPSASCSFLSLLISSSIIFIILEANDNEVATAGLVEGIDTTAVDHVGVGITGIFGAAVT